MAILSSETKTGLLYIGVCDGQDTMWSRDFITLSFHNCYGQMYYYLYFKDEETKAKHVKIQILDQGLILHPEYIQSSPVQWRASQFPWKT